MLLHFKDAKIFYKRRNKLLFNKPKLQIQMTNELPTVTVAIVAHKSGEIIEQCLKSVRNQTYPQDKYSVIVVDDSDDAKTKVLCDKYNAKYIYAPTTDSPGKARNVALKNTDSDLIAFIDTDCVAPPDWLTKIANDLLAEDDVAGVAGAYAGGKKWIERVINKEHIRNVKIKGFSTGFLEGNCAFKLSALNGKRFGEHKYAEGVVLANQLSQANLKLLTDYDLRVVHNGFTHTLRKFFKMGKIHYHNTKTYFGNTAGQNTIAVGAVTSLLFLTGIPFLGPLLALPALLLSAGFLFYSHMWHSPVPWRMAVAAYAYFLVARWLFWMGYFAELVRNTKL
jgi:glycosyltransferase involved in cell wall biosynthesis